MDRPGRGHPAGDGGSKVDELLTRLQALGALGISEAHGWVPKVWETDRA